MAEQKLDTNDGVKVYESHSKGSINKDTLFSSYIVKLLESKEVKNDAFKASLSSDMPDKSVYYGSSTECIVFKKLKSGQMDYCWSGFEIKDIKEGSNVTMSVWIKFVNKIPSKSDNFGFKHYGHIENEWVDQCKVGEWKKITVRMDAPKLGDDAFNLLIFDTMEKDIVVQWVDFSLLIVSDPVNKEISNDEFKAELKKIGELAPEWKEFIAKHEDLLAKRLQSKDDLDLQSNKKHQAMYGEGEQIHQKIKSKEPASDHKTKSNIGNDNELTVAILFFVFQVCLFVFSLAGFSFNVEWDAAIERSFMQCMGQDVLNGLQRQIGAFVKAETALSKSRALFDILSAVYNANVFGAFWDAIKHGMHWYDWIITGAVFAAQITAWVCTDGTAFVAECCLRILGAVQLIEAGVQVVAIIHKRNKRKASLNKKNKGI